MEHHFQPSSNLSSTDQVIGYDDVDKREVGGREVNLVAMCKGGVLYH